MIISVATTENKIWEVENFVISLCAAMNQQSKIIIDLQNEGPDAEHIGLYNLIEACANKFNYNLNCVTLKTCNMLEKHSKINVEISNTNHLLMREIEKHYDHDQPKQDQLQHFGMFVGRANAPRLFLSEYLNTNYKTQTVSTYHYKHNDDYHRDNIGLEELIKHFDIDDVSSYSEFITNGPYVLGNIDYNFDKTKYPKGIDFSSRLHQIEKESFIQLYRKFLVEIVSETFYNGNTFFITEKTFRPILLRTPFIIQGSQDYLKYLKQLGFKTFDAWWDEGYSEDPPNWSIHEIVKVIDFIGQKTTNQLHTMYKEMQTILDHNYENLLDLHRNGQWTI